MALLLSRILEYAHVLSATLSLCPLASTLTPKIPHLPFRAEGDFDWPQYALVPKSILAVPANAFHTEYQANPRTRKRYHHAQ